MRRRGARRWALPVVVGLVGVLSGAAAAAAGGIPATDAVQLIGYATVGAAIAGAIAALVGTALRRTNVGVQAAVAALAPVVATGIGVAWASARMFLMAHDLWVLAVVLCSAGGVGVIVSILLGRRVSVAVRSVGAMARRLGEAGPSMDLAATGRAGGVPGELAALAGELQLTSTRLAEAQEQASALERSRRELVAWVSHDLRTPLAGIRAMVEALEDGVVDDPETIARYHRTIRQEADRLAGLVNDLFELSRIQAGSLALRYEAVPLDDFVADAISGAAVAAGTKGIEVRTQMRTSTPSTVELSTPEMARVVRNLLDNAIRHTPPGGTIVVDVGIDEGDTAAVVSVLDGCGGIPEIDLDRVFEMAFRGDTSRTPGEGGGLGLAVARGLVEAHQGDITVHNEGPGCRFVVRLPLRHP
jgi:signal transduction histidine kinase